MSIHVYTIDESQPTRYTCGYHACSQVFAHACCVYTYTCMYTLLLHNSHTHDDELVTRGVYGLVRHPMYTGLLITLWSQPTMVRLITCTMYNVYTMCAAVVESI